MTRIGLTFILMISFLHIFYAQKTEMYTNIKKSEYLELKENNISYFTYQIGKARMGHGNFPVVQIEETDSIVQEGIWEIQNDTLIINVLGEYHKKKEGKVKYYKISIKEDYSDSKKQVTIDFNNNDSLSLYLFDIEILTKRDSSTKFYGNIIKRNKIRTNESLIFDIDLIKEIRLFRNDIYQFFPKYIPINSKSNQFKISITEVKTLQELKGISWQKQYFLTRDNELYRPKYNGCPILHQAVYGNTWRDVTLKFNDFNNNSYMKKKN